MTVRRVPALRMAVHGGDPVAALVDGHVARVFIVESNASARCEQADEPVKVIPGKAAGG